ncbi:LLM class flavin-dependent oxidoreductase [Jidongwangia harbinensis]|uniref:LLM class flavin-dependent oxidoreductase n=1 Tax=Jidongwangia harbinensis TaxID=2878561 RepID=UPI003FD6CEFF
MELGIYSVGDVTPDPVSGRTPSEGQRLAAMVTIAVKAEEVGLDVFAAGEHHHPPYVASSPATLLGYVAARTERLMLSTATTLITTNDPVRITEDYAVLQHLAGGRFDLIVGRGSSAPVCPLFGRHLHESEAAGRRELRAAAPALA